MVYLVMAYWPATRVLRQKCTTQMYLEVLPQCGIYSGKLQPFRLNYDSIGKSLQATFFAVERVDMFNLIELGIVTDRVTHWIYHLAHFVAVLILGTYFNMILRGLIVSLCYVTNERLSIVNIDEGLTKAEKEMVMTEEMFIKTKLQPRHEKINNKWSIAAALVSKSWFWRVFFNSLSIFGFIINTT